MKNFFSGLKKKAHKVSAIFLAFCMSMCMAVTCFAVDGSTSTGGVDYTAIGDALKTGVSDAVTGTVACVSAIIPICVGIFGLGICVKTFKKFVGKLM